MIDVFLCTIIYLIVGCIWCMFSKHSVQRAVDSGIVPEEYVKILCKSDGKVHYSTPEQLIHITLWPVILGLVLVRYVFK